MAFPLVDEQLAGASQGLKVTGMVLLGTTVP
jgi:hypothetical protein